MGALLHALHAHQPLPRGPYPTLKWPEGCTQMSAAVVKESLTTPVQSKPGLVPSGMVRAQWLIDANKAAHTDGVNVKWHLVATDHEATIRALADRVNVAEGNNLKAARGCSLAYLVFGPLEVAVEYEFEPASGDGWNEPRYEASVSVLRVYLNGYWCDADDVASEDQIRRWEERLLEGEDA